MYASQMEAVESPYKDNGEKVRNTLDRQSMTERLEKDIAVLHETLGTLESKLQVFLRMESDKDPGITVNDADINASEATNRLYGHSQQIEYAISRIASLLDRLDA